MGSGRGRRSRGRYPASLRQKTLSAYLARIVAREFPPPGGLVSEVAGDAANQIRYLLPRGLGDIRAALISGRHFHAKRDPRLQPEKTVSLSIITAEDIEMLEWMGSAAALTSRMARVLEDACAADASFDGRRLALLFPLSLRALRNRLKALWTCGAFLPLAGTSRRHRKFWEDLRGVIAIREHLRGEALGSLQRRMLFPAERWRTWCRGYARVYNCFVRGARDADEIAWRLELPTPMVEGWLSIILDLGTDLASPNPLGEASLPDDPYDGSFHVRLIHRYDYPPPAALGLCKRLASIARTLGQPRGDGTIIYLAKSANEPAGRALERVALQPVYLDYLHAEDPQYLDVERPVVLRTVRLKRWVRQAREQGGVLSQYDLAYLSGLSTDAVGHLLARDEDPRTPPRPTMR